MPEVETNSEVKPVPAEEAPVDKAPVNPALQALDEQLQEHEAQHKQLSENLATLEREYAQKKEWATSALAELRGAIFALRGLKDKFNPPAEASKAE